MRGAARCGGAGRGAIAIGAVAMACAGCHAPSAGKEAPKPVATAAAPASASAVPTAAPSSSYRTKPVTDGRTVEVRLSYTGKPRAPWTTPVAFASHCGGATQVPDPSDPADGKGGVVGAVVWVEDVREGEAPVASDALLDQKGCAFAPHVAAMVAGAKLGLANEDPANHAVRLDFVGGPEDESVVKMLPPAGKDAVTTSPAWAGRVGRVTCPIHPWMLAWVHFFDHPYFAVTQAGVARIPRVPPGTWHVSVWHEALDAKLGDTVTEGPAIHARFDVTVKDRDVALSLVLDADGTITARSR
jgi:hypothetical protein